MNNWRRAALGIFIFLLMCPIFTVQANSTEPAFELILSRANLVVGEAAAWEAAIQPPAGVALSGITFELVDPQAWQILSASPVPEPCTGPAVISLQVLALKPGDHFPMLRLTYTLDGVRKQHALRAAEPIVVSPVTALVNFSLVASQMIPTGQTDPNVVFEVENASPFSIQLSLEDQSSGLALHIPSVIEPIAAGARAIIPLPSKVTQDSAVPRLRVTYTWADLTQPYSAHRLVSAGTTQKQANLWVEKLTTLFSVLAGAVIGFLSTQVHQFFDRGRQVSLDRERVHCLLWLAASEVKSAGKRGATVDLSVLRIVFEGDRSYAVLKEENLFKLCVTLWRKADKYNQDLQKLHGAQRLGELIDAAEALQKRLLALDRSLESTTQTAPA